MATKIDSAFIADMREFMSSGKDSEIAELSPSGFSIGGVVQLACIKSVCTPWFNSKLEMWRKSSTVLNDAILTFEGGQLPSTANMWEARGLEFFPIRGKDWADSKRYHPFESRFCKAAKQAGFGNKAKAFAGALYEIADNVAQHSGDDSSCPAPGVIGYFICDGHVAFAVADLGRGILNSLRENPAWQQLPDSKAALMAVVTDHASRRPNGGDGEGFKEVFRSLANINGLIELLSSEGRVRIVSTPDGRQATPQFTGSLPGFQLSVNCSLNSVPGERIFPLDYLT
jgi:anti-sigma regulatory factor (Ser/Thr protein kinase)